MGKCDRCEGDDALSYTCNECGGTFCTEHRLPEAHNCDALRSRTRSGWFKDELSSRKHGRSGRVPRNQEDAAGAGEADSSGSDSPTCLECGRITERTCDDCGGAYCERHKSPRTHNCAFLDEPLRSNSDDADTSLTGTLLSVLLFPIVLMTMAARGVYRLLTAPVRRPALGIAVLLVSAGALATTGHLDGMLETEGDPVEQTEPGGVVAQTAETASASGPTDIDLERVEHLVHERINEIRANQSLSPLEHEPALREIASRYSKQMAIQGFYGHTSPRGEDFQDRYEDAGYSCRVPISENRYATGAENIQYTHAFVDVRTDRGTVHYDTEAELAEGLVAAWMNSQGHRENILRDYWQNEGIGVYAIENPDGPGVRVYATQNFC